MARSTWVPNQHGAWAMLVTPVVVGSLLGTLRPLHLLLLVTWLAAYCANFYLSLAMKTRRWSKYRPQLMVYGGAAAVGAVPLLNVEPQLWWIAAVAGPTFLLNAYLVRERNERSWLNDLAGIVLAFAVGFGAFHAGYDGADRAVVEHAWRAIGIVSLYSAGTVFYVKTMIRERGSALWMRVSVGFHFGLLAVVLLMHYWWLVGVAAAALLRSIVVPRLEWTPKRIGMVEIVFTMTFGLGVLR